jgi:hypothetical protein
VDGQCKCTCDLDNGGAPLTLAERVSEHCIKFTLPNNADSCCRIDDFFIPPGNCFDKINQVNGEFFSSEESCARALGSKHCRDQEACSGTWECGASLITEDNGNFLLRITVPTCNSTEFTICGRNLTVANDTPEVYKIKIKNSTCFEEECFEVTLNASFQCPTVTDSTMTEDDESEETTPVTEQGLTALYIAIPFIALAIIFIVVILACRRRRRTQGNIDVSSVSLLAAEHQRPQFGSEWSDGKPYMRKQKYCL